MAPLRQRRPGIAGQCKASRASQALRAFRGRVPRPSLLRSSTAWARCCNELVNDRPRLGGAFPQFLPSSGPSTGAFPRLRAPNARNRGSTHWRLSLNAEKLPSCDQSPSATACAQLSWAPAQLGSPAVLVSSACPLPPRGGPGRRRKRCPRALAPRGPTRGGPGRQARTQSASCSPCPRPCGSRCGGC
jgi:hypothetical protein